MIKVLAACGNGMGSSMIIKMKIDKILKEMNIPAEIHHASVGQAKSDAKNYDLILVSKVFEKEFNIKGNTKVVGLVNMLSDEEIKNSVSEALGL
ncbi:PTS sugar transporter subunit IIB [Wukongibacter baidiensis]|uniref:PTS sugar transporter subunit IIB n=1 Tax=Wukongibacter baidiensis TaxID=1723361 RepID=UPI003D7F71EC